MIYNLPRAKKKGETWVIDSDPRLNTGHEYSIKFISNAQSFNRIYFAEETKFNAYLYYDEIEVADGAGSNRYTFYNETYRTITFLESPTGDLLTWLQSNATKR